MSTVGQAAGGLVGGIAGFFLGGPTGAVYGAQIGLMVGGYLDPPKVKGNHPTTDLSVQTATYGVPVGGGYGNYATYGNVFWVEGNSLRLVTGEDGGGKGGSPKAATPDEIYGTFAIGFGEGEITAFGRIWCNGKLVYDPTAGTLGAHLANGDVAGNLSFYLGSTTQLPDDRIQADMGVDHAPGYRGLHYIVFKDWPMADYGNTLMGIQVKAEILNSVTIAQFERRLYDDEVIPDTNSFPGAGPTEYGYFNPRVENGVFRCDKSSVAHSYAYTFAISYEGVFLSQQAGSVETGVFGYIGEVAAGIVAYSGGGTGTFTVGGAFFKDKTSDPNNTCHGMAVGGDGRIYALERVSGTYLFRIYDGSTLVLISSGANASIQLGDPSVSNPCMPGTNVTFCVEPDGTHVWTAQEGGSESHFKVCTIGATGDLTTLHEWNTATDGYLGSFARFAAIVAVNGVCYGVNDHGGFFIYDRNTTLTPTAVALADIIDDRCLRSGLLDAADIDTSAITQMVRGYKVREVAAIRTSLEPLQGAFPFDIVPSGYQLKFVPRGGSSVATIPAEDLGATAGGETPKELLTSSREMDSQLPATVQVTYIDVNREYDKGTGPGARRLNTDAVNVSALDMPIVLNANEAAAIEDRLLYLYWMERTEYRFTLPPTWQHLEPADVVTLSLPSATYELRLTATEHLPDGRVECTARPNNPAIYTPVSYGQEGQAPGQVLTYPGAALLQLLDIPCVDSTVMNQPGVLAAVSGYTASWPGGHLFRSDDSGQTWKDVQNFLPGVVMGYATNALGSGITHIIDAANVLNVRLFSGALASVTQAAMFNGANHFAVGAQGRWEIIAAENCVQQSDGTWNLSNLMRGRFGSEHALASHAIGDGVVLLDRSAVRFVGLDVASLNLSRLWRAATNGQTIDSAAEVALAYSGENLECLAPIQIKGAKNAAGDWSIGWLRRTRLPVEPFSGIPAPLGESGESYEVEIWDSTWTTLKRTITGLSSATATYTNAQQTSDFGAVQKLLYLRVYQLSATVGRGHAGQGVCGNLALLSVKSLLHFDEATSYGAYRTLALHCDGANASTSFPDVSGNTVTALGNAQISTAQYPSLTGKTSSALLDGSGDYLSVPNSVNFRFGSGEFTIRCRAYFSALPGSGAIYTLVGLWNASGTYSYLFGLNNNAGTYNLNFYYTTNGTTVSTITNAWTPSTATWYDIEVVRTGTSLQMRINGTLVGSSQTLSATLHASTAILTVGGAGADGHYFNGYLSEVEVYKGVAIHTANFSPSSEPFSDSGQVCIDQAQNTVSVVGTAQTVADASAFGGICLQANQSSGYVQLPVIPLTELYWTIDLWIKPDALPAAGYTSGAFQYGTGQSGNDGLCVALYNSGQIVAMFTHGIEINAGTITAGTRTHVFVQRSGANIYIGSGGTVGGSRAVSLTSFDGNKSVRVGYANTLYLDPKAIKIDEFRIFAGEAKYPLSGTYTVPANPFPDL